MNNEFRRDIKLTLSTETDGWLINCIDQHPNNFDSIVRKALEQFFADSGVTEHSRDRYALRVGYAGDETEAITFSTREAAEETAKAIVELPLIWEEAIFSEVELIKYLPTLNLYHEVYDKNKRKWNDSFICSFDLAEDVK